MLWHTVRTVYRGSALRAHSANSIQEKYSQGTQYVQYKGEVLSFAGYTVRTVYSGSAVRVQSATVQRGSALRAHNWLTVFPQLAHSWHRVGTLYEH